MKRELSIEPLPPTNAELEQLSNYIFAYWREEYSRLEASESLALVLLPLGYHRHEGESK